jgi:alpha-galactosidase
MRAVSLVVLTLCEGAVPDARTPPLGWRSWNLYESNVNQDLINTQVDALVMRKHSLDGNPTSLHDLGYQTIGIDDGWQDCGAGPHGTYHDKDGHPLVNKSRFADMGAMVSRARAKNVSMGWVRLVAYALMLCYVCSLTLQNAPVLCYLLHQYHNNCGCNEAGKEGATAHYKTDSEATGKWSI